MNKKLAIIAALLLTAAAATMCFGISYGRYMTEINQTLTFEAKTLTGSGTVTLLSQNGWEQTQNGIKMDFSVIGENVSNDVYLRLSATEGLDSGVAIKLTSGDIGYTAKAVAVAEGTQLYQKMGAGTEYRFFNGENELALRLAEQKSFTLSVEGASDAALLRLYVS